MNEAKFNHEVIKSLRRAGAFAHKLADMPKGAGAFSRFNPPKPCDIIAGYKGLFIGIESKQLKKWEGFSIKKLRPNQIEALDEMIAARCAAFVFVNVRITEKRVNILIPLNWKIWGDQLKCATIKKEQLKGLAFDKGLFSVEGLYRVEVVLNMAVEDLYGF